MRRDAVLGLSAPFVTAFPIADTAWRKRVLASSVFFSATADWTFFTTVFTLLMVD
jgi:hypothetical protein